MSSSPLSIQRLTHRFQAGTVNEKTALDHLSLEVPARQFVTVLGSNGSGKTTLFNMILGKLIPDEGRILLDGEDITRQKDYRRALNIGCLYQNPLRGTAPDMTIEENLALAYTRKASRSFFAVNRNDSRYFRELLATLEMATIAQPKLLLLDEHTAALDPGAAEKVMQLTESIVARHQITTLMVTHDMDYALRVGSRTIMLDSGRIVMDLSGQARAQMTSGTLAELFYTRSKTPNCSFPPSEMHCNQI